MCCEWCHTETSVDTAISIWIGDESFQGERLGFFCNDDCLDKWWNDSE